MYIFICQQNRKKHKHYHCHGLPFLDELKHEDNILNFEPISAINLEKFECESPQTHADQSSSD